MKRQPDADENRSKRHADVVSSTTGEPEQDSVLYSSITEKPADIADATSPTIGEPDPDTALRSSIAEKPGSILDERWHRLAPVWCAFAHERKMRDSFVALLALDVMSHVIWPYVMGTPGRPGKVKIQGKPGPRARMVATDVLQIPVFCENYPIPFDALHALDSRGVDSYLYFSSSERLGATLPGTRPEAPPLFVEPGPYAPFSSYPTPPPAAQLLSAAFFRSYIPAYKPPCTRIIIETPTTDTTVSVFPTRKLENLCFVPVHNGFAAITVDHKIYFVGANRDDNPGSMLRQLSAVIYDEKYLRKPGPVSRHDCRITCAFAFPAPSVSFGLVFVSDWAAGLWWVDIIDQPQPDDDERWSMNSIRTRVIRGTDFPYFNMITNGAADSDGIVYLLGCGTPANAPYSNTSFPSIVRLYNQAGLVLREIVCGGPSLDYQWFGLAVDAKNRVFMCQRSGSRGAVDPPQKHSLVMIDNKHTRKPRSPIGEKLYPHCIDNVRLSEISFAEPSSVGEPVYLLDNLINVQIDHNGVIVVTYTHGLHGKPAVTFIKELAFVEDDEERPVSSE